MVPVALQELETVISVDDLSVSFGGGPDQITAVDHVQLNIRSGDIYAIVGESGCGKSTLAYAMLRAVPPPGRISTGEVRYRGQSLSAMGRDDVDRLRAAEVSMVFQAAMNSFNPVLSIGRQVDHLLTAHDGVFATLAEGWEYFAELLRMVRLEPEQVCRSFEHQLSGGMKQRAAIAFALALRPTVLVLDEPTTALDVWNQRIVLDVLQELHQALGLTIVFITHDLAIVAELAEQVGVMYAGRLVESGSVYEIFGQGRRHPYVSALISAIPSMLDQGLNVHPIGGQVPNLADLPMGCRFAPRCPLAKQVCRQIDPPLLADHAGHSVACHVANEAMTGSAE